MKKIITVAAIALIVVIGCEQKETNKANTDIIGFWGGKYDLKEDARNATANSEWTVHFRPDGTCRAYDRNISDTSNCFTYEGKYEVIDSIVSITALCTDNSGDTYIFKNTITNNSTYGELTLKNDSKEKPRNLKGKASLSKL